MPSAQEFINLALSQKGDRYVFGAEASFGDANPDAFDCSELVEWTARRLGVNPPVPDGAYNQWYQCRSMGLLIDVGTAVNTVGALLFIGDGVGSGRDAITHVAISLGNGYTIEARGSKWGVGVWSAHRGFNFGALMRGVGYRPGMGPNAAPPAAQVKTRLQQGDEGPDVEFMQAMFNILIPQIYPHGFTNGELLDENGDYDGTTASVNRSVERFWNKHSPRTAPKLHADFVFTFKGTAPAVAAMVEIALWFQAHPID